MEQCLLICNIQPDILAFTVDGDTLAQRIATYVTTNREHYRRVYLGGAWNSPVLEGYFTDHPDYQEWFPIHAMEGTPGAEFAPEMLALIGDANEGVINGKYHYGMYQAPRSMFEASTLKNGYLLDNRLKYFGTTHIDVCGAGVDSLVYQTALDGVALGYSVRLIDDLSERFVVRAETPYDIPKLCARFGIDLVNSGTAWLGQPGGGEGPPAHGAAEFAGVAEDQL